LKHTNTNIDRLHHRDGVKPVKLRTTLTPIIPFIQMLIAIAIRSQILKTFGGNYSTLFLSHTTQVSMRANQLHCTMIGSYWVFNNNNIASLYPHQ